MQETAFRTRWAFPVGGLAVLLAACGSPSPSEQEPSPAPATATPEAAGPLPAVTEDAPPVSSGDTIRAATPEAAVRAYYDAIDAGDFAGAYRLWRDGGAASGQGYEAFRRGFAETRSTEVTITGPVAQEGAAGSIYATVPVEVNAVLQDGTQQRFVGEYVLRRVNDVPGATEEQRSWHIESARLAAVR